MLYRGGLGLTKPKIEEFLKETDLSKETQEIIVNLFVQNNKAIEDNVDAFLTTKNEDSRIWGK